MHPELYMHWKFLQIYLGAMAVTTWDFGGFKVQGIISS